jgi:hypothetical protein
MGRMRRRGFLAQGVLAALALALAGAAVAAKPVILTIPIDETSVIRCQGFQLEESVQGTIKIRSFSENGQIVREVVSVSLLHTVTNEAGESLSTPDVGVDFVRINPDGSATLAVIGLVGRITVPGEGLIAADVGRVVFFFESLTDEEPDVLFQAGKHDDLTAALCEALAP